jgi:hypothetical protein
MTDDIPAKKASAKKASAKKAAAKKATAKKTTAKKTPAKKAPAKKSATKKKSAAKTDDAASPDEAEPTVQAEPAGHDHDHAHDHAGHDHDHDHDDVEMEIAERDVERMAASLAALDDEALRHALNGITEKSRAEIAGQLNLPRATMHLGDAWVPLVRRKLRTANPDRQLQVVFALVERVNDQTVAALGTRSDDPSRDDMIEVLPAVIDKHGAPLVTAMLAGYAASDAECRPVMRELLDTDERFAVGEAVALEEVASAGLAAAPVVDEKTLAEKREQRRAAKEAKRAAEQREKQARANAQAARRQALHDAKRKGR